jgi:hypothetical protein
MMNDRSHSNSPANLRLTPEDERAVDVLVDAGFDRTALKSLSDAEQSRVEAVSSVLGLLDDYPVEDCDETLVHATLARIERHEDVLADRMNFQAQREQAAGLLSRRKFRLPDFITVAAVILIGTGVMWPILTGVKQKSLDLACDNNLKNLAFGFKQYAADNNGSMPFATAGFAGSVAGRGWGREASTITTAPLIQGKYCEHQHLNCPGHSDQNTASYSSRWQHAQAPTQLEGARLIILLGDCNPISTAARRGLFLSPLSNGPNHGGRGQNVLSNDGAVLWLTVPVIGGSDNIWLPDGVTELRPGAEPIDPWDTFLD